MAEATVIIHGWSDCSESFVDMKSFLVHSGVGRVETVYYGDYESREDSMTFEDVADGLNDEFIRLGFIDAAGKRQTDLNVIVHSTGGLVIRHWLWRYYLRDGYRLADCPVRRLVMLAPANFGSPLAHRGKSFLGTLVKGRWKVGDLLEVGRNLLEGLELASPYQWRLAHHDLLVRRELYGASKVQTTILVGGDDYSGLRRWVNKPGTDGTVVISGTSLDSVKLILDCCGPAVKRSGFAPYSWSETRPVTDVAFGVLRGLNHGSIVSATTEPDGGIVGPWLLRALRTTGAADFRRLRRDLTAETGRTYRHEGRKPYQQFLVHAVDDQGQSIRDFTLDFFVARAGGGRGRSAAEEELSVKAARLMTAQFHTHSVDPSYRRFLVCRADVEDLLKLAAREIGPKAVLGMRVFVPKIDAGIQYDTAKLQNIALVGGTAGQEGAPAFLYDNTTTLLELRVDRTNRYVKVGLKPRKH